MLKLPDSTLRRYAISFQDHLSLSGRKKGKHRLYTQSDILLFARARELFNDGLKPEEVNARLSVIGEELPTADEILSAVPGISSAIEKVSAENRSLRETVQTLTQKIETITAQQQEDLKRSQEIIDRLQALEAERRQPWYKRLFK